MWVNLTLGVTPEMAEEIEDEANSRGMSRNEYLRHLIRESPNSPFDGPENSLPDRTDGEATKGAA